MFRPLLLATLLVIPAVAPSVAAAQRGGRTQSDRRTELFDKDSIAPKGLALRLRDIEDQSPLKLLIDKRKDLKLTDAQLSQLKDAEPKLKDKNALLFKMVDSLLHDLRPSSGRPSDEERARKRAARSGLATTLDAIHANNDAAAKDAMTSFDADQQHKATDLLAKQREEGDKLIRDRLGDGGRS
jgi:hypothetical protein